MGIIFNDSRMNRVLMHSSETQLLRIGTTLDDRYEIVAYLGCGGMGSVYKARHAELDRAVAIKVLHPRFCGSNAAIVRFQREAKILSTLTHPNMLTVYGFGGAKGVIYLAMEYVQGASLGRLIEEKGRLQPAVAIQLLLEICDAMSCAHKNDVLHRDLKPDNVMIVTGADGEYHAKVVDFGLAKLVDDTNAQRLTKTGEVVGDPRYMSPEQCYGKKLDARSDIYSFGCLMYEVLTGRLPFDGVEPVAIMHKHIDEEAKSFAKDLRIPAALETITMTALAKDKQLRYSSFDEVKELLLKVAECPEIEIAATINRRSGKQAAKTPIAIVTFCAIVGVGTMFWAVTGFPTWDLMQGYAKYALAIDASQKAKSALSIAEYYIAGKDYSNAVALLEEAARIYQSLDDRNSVFMCRLMIGNLYFEQNRLAEAESLYSEFLMEALELARKSNAMPASEKVLVSSLRNYSSLRPDASIQLAQGFSDAYVSNNMPISALNSLFAISAAGSKEIQANSAFSIGLLALKQKHFRDAQTQFDRSIELSRNNTRFNRASKVISEVRRAGTKSMVIHFQKVQAEYLGQADLRGKLALEIQIADEYFRQSDFPAAQEFYSAGLQLANRLRSERNLRQCLHGLGRTYLMLGKHERAEEMFRQEISRISVSKHTIADAATAYWCLGLSLHAQNDYENAAVALQKALALVSIEGNEYTQQLKKEIAAIMHVNRIQVFCTRGLSALQRSEFVDAEKIYRSQIEYLKPISSADAQRVLSTTSLGDALSCQGRLDEAVAEYESAAQLIEKNKGLFSQAVKHELESKLGRSKTFNQIAMLHKQAEAKYREGNYAGTEQAYRQQIALYRQLGQDSDEGLGTALDLLGSALLAQGKDDEALKQFLEAQQLIAKCPKTATLSAVQKRVESHIRKAQAAASR